MNFYRCLIIFKNTSSLNIILKDISKQQFELKISKLIDSVLKQYNSNMNYEMIIYDSSEEEFKLLGNVSYDKSMLLN